MTHNTATALIKTDYTKKAKVKLNAIAALKKYPIASGLVIVSWTGLAILVAIEKSLSPGLIALPFLAIGLISAHPALA